MTELVRSMLTKREGISIKFNLSLKEQVYLIEESQIDQAEIRAVISVQK